MLEVSIAVAAFVGAWVGFSVSASKKGMSRTIGIGGGFLVACIFFAVVAWLVIPSPPAKETEGPSGNAAKQAQPTAPVLPKKDHNYVMQDGMKYGYPAAISDDARRSGQVAEQLVMALYAGERNGKYQAHIMDGVTVSALECSSPCEYVKIMTFIDNPYLRDQVKVEHIAVAPNSLARFIMEDAINGKLKQYGVGTEEKMYNVWVDEKKGMTRTPIQKR